MVNWIRTSTPKVALDLIFGAAIYRMATGHGGLTPADADAPGHSYAGTGPLISWSGADPLAPLIRAEPPLLV